MARRHGPQLRNLMYDRASAADDLMRSEAADSHQGQERDRSSNRPDRFSPGRSRWTNRSKPWPEMPFSRMVLVFLSPARRKRDVGAAVISGDRM